MRARLQIYLDSSDFSKFADPGDHAKELKEIEDFLFGRKADGSIAIRYSESHVVEAAPTRIEDVPAATRRYAKIHALCGTDCLAHFMDIVGDEVRRVRQGGRLPRESAWRHDGFWYPRQLEDTLFLSPEAPLRLLHQMGRSERRKFLKDDKLTPFARAALAASGRLLDLPPGEFPLGRRAILELQRYYDGLVSDGEAERRLRSLLGDVREFGHWYEADPVHAMQFSSYLRTFGKEFKDLRATWREGYVQELASAIALGESPKTLDNIVSETFTRQLREASASLARTLSATLGLGRGSLGVDDVGAALPALSSATMLTLELARRSVFHTQPRKGTVSDLGDIFHVAYMPYVDIYRTDGPMANVIREAQLARSTEVVARLEHLPAAIERQLAARSGGEGQPIRTVG
jgi:hypothetical protein